MCDERDSYRKVGRRVVEGRVIVQNYVKFKVVNTILVPPNMRTASNEILYLHVKSVAILSTLYCVVVKGQIIV